MLEKLNNIMVNEYDALKSLLLILERQHELCAKKDVFKLESVIDEIEAAGKKVAKLEVERRKLTGGNSMKEIVQESENDEVQNNYRKIKLLLEEIRVQKDTNELMIKQQLFFSKKMLNLISPKRNANLYNSRGILAK